MLYPKCPKCGAKTVSNEEGEDEWRWKVAGHQFAKIHPVAGMAASAVSAARNVAKRTSLMEKRCTECGHTFH